MQEKLPGGAGVPLTFLVTPWLTSSPTSDDFAVVTTGQLKNLAKPFYARLIEAGLAQDYPWTATTADDDDFALANIGMAKKLFSFELPTEAPVILSLVSGSNQSAVAGDILAAVLKVRVTKGEEPQVAVEVSYQCSVGSLGGSAAGSWSEASAGLGAMTDAQGYASLWFKTPASTTAGTVTARLATGQTVTFPFHATATTGGGEGGDDGGEDPGTDPNDPTTNLALNLVVTTPNR